MLHDRSEVTWTNREVAGGEHLLVPSFYDIHGWFDVWELDRFKSLKEHLKPGMSFHEIGGYDGWQSAIISRYLGGAENMVIVEPEPQNWANIRAEFEMNNCGMPKGTYLGFVANGSDFIRGAYVEHWPEGPDYSKLISHTCFRHLSDCAENNFRISLDGLAELFGKPAAINIDVEGAELNVLQSGEAALREWHPLVWVSIHPEFMEERYGHKPERVFEFMKDCGYKAEYLGDDHELHYAFFPVDYKP